MESRGYSIIERGSKYYVVFRDSSGKQHCKSTKVPILNTSGKQGKQYILAQQAALKIIEESETAPEEVPKTKFEDLVSMWLKTYEKDYKSEATFITYGKDVEKHILPYFKDKLPEEITSFDVKEFLAAVGKYHIRRIWIEPIVCIEIKSSAYTYSGVCS